MATLTIVRGVPGSGKSTIAKALANASAIRYYEADMYFVNPETAAYEFDPSKLRSAHSWCQQQVELELKAGRDVIVSNTFTTRKEVKPYVALANEYNAYIQLIECKGQFQNVHGVPEEKVAQVKARWQEIEL
jgi:predicted kinase